MSWESGMFVFVGGARVDDPLGVSSSGAGISMPVFTDSTPRPRAGDDSGLMPSDIRLGCCRSPQDWKHKAISRQPRPTSGFVSTNKS